MAQTNSRIPFWLAVLLIAVLGIIFIFVSAHWRWSEFTGRVGEALLISALLAVGVDTYVKRKLATDVANDISPYAIGALLPNEVRREIADLVQTTVIRSDFQVTYRLDDIPEHPGYVKAAIQVSYTVENLASKRQDYLFRIQAEKSLFPLVGETKIQGFGLVTTSRKRSYTIRPGDRRFSLEDKGRHIEVAHEEKLPKSPHERYRFWVEYAQIFRENYTDIISIGHPTIGMTVRVEPRPDINWTVTFSKDGQPRVVPGDRPQEWTHPGVFLTGQHARIWWEKVIIPTGPKNGA